VSSVLRPHQHSMGYTGDGFYRSKDPTNSIKVLKEDLQKSQKTTKTTKRRWDCRRGTPTDVSITNKSWIII